MERVDRRIQRTQGALMDGLIALALERGYDSISIRDVTDRANVAYSTFFRHYASLDELLTELLQSVVAELAGLIDHQPNKSPEAEGLLIFRHVAANAAFFRLLFSSPAASRVLRSMQDRLAAEVLASNAVPLGSPIPPEVAANHFVATILALIDWWLRHEMPYPVERMAAIYSRLIAQWFASAVAVE